MILIVKNKPIGRYRRNIFYNSVQDVEPHENIIHIFKLRIKDVSYLFLKYQEFKIVQNVSTYVQKFIKKS